MSAEYPSSPVARETAVTVTALEDWRLYRVRGADAGSAGGVSSFSCMRLRRVSDLARRVRSCSICFSCS